MSKLTLQTFALTDGDVIKLLSPGVGEFKPSVAPGSMVTKNSIGTLTVLGRVHQLIAPPSGWGIAKLVQSTPQSVGYKDVLLELSPASDLASGSQTADASQQKAADSTFRIPLGGRYYARPQPGAEPFVAVGQVIDKGKAVGLIEVMKTFNRIAFAGDLYPDRVRVVRVLIDDGADIDSDAALFEFEPA